MYLKNLKYMRMSFGLSQMELSKILNISQYSYVKLETCKISLNNKSLKKLLDYFNVGLDQLTQIDINLKQSLCMKCLRHFTNTHGRPTLNQ